MTTAELVSIPARFPQQCHIVAQIGRPVTSAGQPRLFRSISLDACVGVHVRRLVHFSSPPFGEPVLVERVAEVGISCCKSFAILLPKVLEDTIGDTHSIADEYILRTSGSLPDIFRTSHSYRFFGNSYDEVDLVTAVKWIPFWSPLKPLRRRLETVHD